MTVQFEQDRDEVIRLFFEDFDKRLAGDHEHPVPPERREEFASLRPRLALIARFDPDYFVESIADFFERNPELLRDA